MPKKSRKNVGLIGLGIIGSRVANALRVGGFHVYVWNRTPRAAPNFLASPRQVAELCDVIQLFVADAQALFDVLEAMGDALTSSHIIICNATVGPEATLEAARMVQERGGQFLDAPFAGSKAAAQNRELVYYIGGEDKTLEAVEGVLQASSKEIVKIGKVGDAAVIKVATNMIVAVTVQTLAEAYAIVKESGVAPGALAEALKHHGVRSAVGEVKLAKMLERDYEPHFSLKHMFKDVQLGIHIANSLDIDLPATTATAGVMYGGLTKGWADDDVAVLGRAYQKEAPAVTAEKGPILLKGPGEAKAAPVAPEPGGEKKEVPRESNAEELRNMGIKLPEATVETVAAKAPEVPKTDGVTASEGLPEVKSETAKGEAPKEAGKVEALAKKAVDGAEKTGTGAPEENRGNGAPGETEREHTPFVRIRRWFGTGSPS